MSRTIMQACTCFVIGMIAIGVSELLDSQFLSEFISTNLLLLLVALMAINSTTASVVLAKMRELADRKPDLDFANTRKSMLNATLEQLVLIVLSATLQVVAGSTTLLTTTPIIEYVVNSLLIAVFAFALQIQYDTAKAVYVILDHEHPREDSE